MKYHNNNTTTYFEIVMFIIDVMGIVNKYKSCDM